MTSILDPDYVPGKDWTHRIDAVPSLGRSVSIKLVSGEIFEATVRRSTVMEEILYQGIGCSVVYETHSTRILSGQIEFWKYA